MITIQEHDNSVCATVKHAEWRKARAICFRLAAVLEETCPASERWCTYVDAGDARVTIELAGDSSRERRAALAHLRRSQERLLVSDA